LGDRTTATLRPRQDPLPPLPPPRALSKVHDSHCSCTLVVVNSSAPPPQLVHPSQHLGPVSAPFRRFSCVVPAAPLFQRCQEGKRAFSLHIFPLGCRPCPPAHTSPLFHCAGSDPEQPGSEQESTRAPGQHTAATLAAPRCLSAALQLTI
jgi:hypothetical protein